MIKILLVEDDLGLSNSVFDFLDDFADVMQVFDGDEGLYEAESGIYDLILLDLMLPEKDGFQVLKELRDKGVSTPVLIMTAKESLDDKGHGFELGADDYIIKPFRPRDLELRILSILKRAYPEKEDTLVLPACQVHFSQALITKGKLEIQLTAKEYSILKVLYDNKNRIVTFDQLLEKVWGLQYQGYDNTLMAHIRKIRQKIEANPSKPESLITVKGLGYKLKVN